MRAMIAAAITMGALALGAPAFAQPDQSAPVFAPAADVPMGSGPFKAIMTSDPGLPDMTIYRPADFAALGDQKLPIVIWGNGACAAQSNAFRAFLSEIASYGYFIIALGNPDPSVPLYETNSLPTPPPPPGATAAPPFRLPANLPPPPTRTAQMIAAMDWAGSPAARSGAYADRLDNAAIAVMGMSCGGAQTIEASADPRVRTSVVWNAGLFPGGTNMAGGKNLTKDDLNALHAPTAYISGDESDIAFVNANDDYARLAARGLPVFRGWERGIGHGGNYGRPGGGEFGGIAIAWLNWQLKGDQRAAGMFRGDNCGLCVNPRWVTQSSNLN